MASKKPRKKEPAPLLPSLASFEQRDVDDLRAAAARYPTDTASLPWVLVAPWSRASEPDVVASVLAVQMIRPSLHTKPEPWLVRALLARDATGQPFLKRLSVEHLEGSVVEVTSAVVHAVNAAQIRDRAYAKVRVKQWAIEALGKDETWNVAPEDREWAERVSQEVSRAPRRRGRKGLPDEHYVRIALRCIELFDSGERKVVRALADEENKSYDTVRDWIATARRRGFLAGVGQGKTSFRPGPELRAPNRKEE